MSNTLGISLGQKCQIFLSPPDGGLRVFAHNGVSSNVPTLISVGPTSNLYGVQAANAWQRFPATTYPNLKRLVGLRFDKDTLTTTPTTTSVPGQDILNKDIRTFKDNIILDQGKPLYFHHEIFSSLFHDHDVHKLLQLSPQVSPEVLLASFLSTIHTSWATQSTDEKPLPLTYLCTDFCPTLQPIKGIVTTVPPWFSTQQRIGIIHAFELANLPLIDIINDPFAILHTYTLQRQITTQKYVIFFDLGHTETTVSLASITPQKSIAEVIDYESAPHLGVRDLIDLVIKRAKVAFDKWAMLTFKQKVDIFTVNHKKYLIQWINLVHKAIEKLTTAPHVDLELPHPLSNDDEFIFKLSRDDFEKDCHDVVLHKFFAPITLLLQRHEELLLNNEVFNEQLTFEIAGSGGRIPMVQRLFTDKFTHTCRNASSHVISRLKFLTTINPDEVIARGAAFASISRHQVASGSSPGKLTYSFNHFGKIWKLKDRTLSAHSHYPFPALQQLYLKLQCSPEYHQLFYNDLYHFKLLGQRDLVLKQFLQQCNVLETMCYQFQDNINTNTTSDSTKEQQQAAITLCHHWLAANNVGDYREVDVMITFLQDIITHGVPLETAQAKLADNLESYRSFVKHENEQKLADYQQIAETQILRREMAADMFKHVSQAMINSWIGADFTKQYYSFALERPDNDYDGGDCLDDGCDYIDSNRSLHTVDHIIDSSLSNAASAPIPWSNPRLNNLSSFNHPHVDHNFSDTKSTNGLETLLPLSSTTSSHSPHFNHHFNYNGNDGLDDSLLLSSVFNEQYNLPMMPKSYQPAITSTVPESAYGDDDDLLNEIIDEGHGDKTTGYLKGLTTLAGQSVNTPPDRHHIQQQPKSALSTAPLSTSSSVTSLNKNSCGNTANKLHVPCSLTSHKSAMAKPTSISDLDTRTMHAYRQLLRLITEVCDAEKQHLITLIKLISSAVTPAGQTKYFPTFSVLIPSFEEKLLTIQQELTELESYAAKINAEIDYTITSDKVPDFNAVWSFRIAQHSGEHTHHQARVNELELEINDVCATLKKFSK